MNYDIFGVTYYQDEWGDWYPNISLEFGSKTYSVGLLVNADEDDNIAEVQLEAYTRFMEQWPTLQQPVLEALVRYYNEEERFSYGPDDEEENAAWWPEIDTPEAMAQAVTPEMLVVPEDFVHDEGRRVGLLFGRVWGGEDLDDNGVAVTFLNEQIDQIGYKDIAL